MLELFDVLRGSDLVSTAVKMLLAVLCGGIIGIEREFKRRPAGFRTHILICIGAAMTTLTSQYLLRQGFYTDPSRLGAQVIAGVGFIGAGTIIVTAKQRVKGLTTAAGLWSSAIVGLTLGAGFFEAGLMATVLILVAEALFSRLEQWMLRRSSVLHLLIEYADKECLDEILSVFQEKAIKVMNMQITRHTKDALHNPCGIFELRLNKKCSCETLLELLENTMGVIAINKL